MFNKKSDEFEYYELDKNSNDELEVLDDNLSSSKLGIGVFLGFAYIFFIPVIIFLILSIIYKSLGLEDSVENLSTIAQFISAVIVIVLMLILMGSNLKKVLRDLVRDKTIGNAILFVIIIVAFNTMYSLIVSPYIQGTTANQEEVNKMMIEMPLLAITFVVLVAPLVEELIFRYFTFNSLKLYVDPKWAIVITTVAFAGIHLLQSIIMGTLVNDLILFPLYLIPSFLITYSYYKTKMFAVPILIHMAYNGYQTAMFYLGKYLLEQLESSSSVVSSFIQLFR